MSTETAVIEAEKTATSPTPIADPTESSMAKAFTEKFFAAEKKEDPKPEPVVEQKVEPVVEKKIEPVAKSAPVQEQKGKSRTALEFDNQRAEYETKLKQTAQERDELKAKAYDMENELNKLREDATTKADYDEVKRKSEELSKIVELIKLEEHPKFKQRYNAQEEYLFKQVDGLLNGTENKDKIIAALKLPKGPERELKLDELKQDLGITKISNLAVYEAKLNELNENKQLELTNASIAKRLYQEEQEQLAAQEKKSHQQIFEKFSQHAIEIDPTYQKVEGKDDYNKIVDMHLDQAKQMYLEDSPEVRAKAMLAYARQPVMIKLIETLSNELRTATEALNGKIAATPGVSASTKVEATKPTTFLGTIQQSLSS